MTKTTKKGSPTKTKPVVKKNNKGKKKSGGNGRSHSDNIHSALASRRRFFKEQKSEKKLIMGWSTILDKKVFMTTLLNMKKKNGTVGYDTNFVWLTPIGEAIIDEDALDVPQTNDAMQQKIRIELVKGDKPRKMFDILLDGRYHTRTGLADALGLPNNKSFGTYTSSLSKVIERNPTNKKEFRLLDMCFPCGRPNATINNTPACTTAAARTTTAKEFFIEI